MTEYFRVTAEGERIRIPDNKKPNIITDKNEALNKLNQEMGGFLIEFCSDELRADKDVVLASLKQYHALQYASPELRNDKEVVLAAVKSYYWALKDASPELKNDKDVVLTAIKESGIALQYASDELRANKEIVLEAVKQDGGALAFASDELKDNEEVVMAAIKQDGFAFRLASDRLRDDLDFFNDAQNNQCEHIWLSASERIQEMFIPTVRPSLDSIIASAQSRANQNKGTGKDTPKKEKCL